MEISFAERIVQCWLLEIETEFNGDLATSHLLGERVPNLKDYGSKVLDRKKWFVGAARTLKSPVTESSVVCCAPAFRIEGFVLKFLLVTEERADECDELLSMARHGSAEKLRENVPARLLAGRMKGRAWPRAPRLVVNAENETRKRVLWAVRRYTQAETVWQSHFTRHFCGPLKMIIALKNAR